MKVYAKDIMAKNVITVSPELPFPDLERRFANAGVGGFPVIDSDKTIRGVVSASDVLARLSAERGALELSTAFYADDPHLEFCSVQNDWVSAEVGKRTDHLQVRDVMTDHVISVTTDTSIHEVAKIMTDKKIHRILVIDDRRLVGVVSSSDIVRACGNPNIDISFTAPPTLDF